MFPCNFERKGVCMDDRRLSERINVSAVCIVYFNGEDVNCPLLNVSETGMCICTDLLQCSDRFDFVIYDEFDYGAGKKKATVRGSAYVVYRDGNRVGCRFCGGIEDLMKYVQDRYVAEFLQR